MKTTKWQKGIAFIHGINMFSNHRINQEKMFTLCKKIESEDVKITKIIKTDNIIVDVVTKWTNSTKNQETSIYMVKTFVQIVMSSTIFLKRKMLTMPILAID